MFDLVSILITFREALEAALIVGILLVYTSKINKRELNKQIWLGTVVGIIVSILFAILFQLILGGFSQYEEFFEGFIMILAAMLLTWMIIWMAQTSQNIRKELEIKVDVALERGHKYGIFVLVLVSVLREGVETVLFLAGVEATGTDQLTIIISGLIGIVIALIVSYLVFVGGKRINIKAFFVTTSILLILFAAGMMTYGVHELQEIGWFGGEAHWLQQQVWDTSAILNDETSELGKFLRALLGYQDKPSSLELIVYFGYYVILATAMFLIKIFTNKGTKEPELLVTVQQNKH